MDDAAAVCESTAAGGECRRLKIPPAVIGTGREGGPVAIPVDAPDVGASFPLPDEEEFCR